MWLLVLQQVYFRVIYYFITLYKHSQYLPLLRQCQCLLFATIFIANIKNRKTPTKPLMQLVPYPFKFKACCYLKTAGIFR